MPNLAAAASRTRRPSGMTSVPMPSPGMTAILCLAMFSWLEKLLDLSEQRFRRFFWDVVSAIEFASADGFGDAAPIRQGLETSLNNSVDAPQNPQRAGELRPGVAIHAVVHQVYGGGGAIVFAH